MKKITDIKNIFASQEIFAVYADCMYMPTWEEFLARANQRHCGFETESYMRQFESGSVRRYKCMLRKGSRLQQIRQAERDSHMKIYASKDLYESGSWLQKPIKTVLDLVPLFQNYRELGILDLGCGVGRNCIPFAQAYPNIPCTIDCVDILDFAIKKLQENAQRYNVTDAINGIVAPIEDFAIAPNTYDLIMAISALEHIDSETSFVSKLHEMQEGIRKNGIVCLVINSNVIEKNKETSALVPPQFEVNLPTEYLQALLNDIFHDWEPIKLTVQAQQYEIPRDSFVSDLRTEVVTFVARKNGGK